MRRVFMTALATAAAGLLASPASADLVYNQAVSSTLLSGQGYGAFPRALTVQATANGSTESGCIGVSSTGALTAGSGSCITAAQYAANKVFQSNGVPNVGGSEANPSGPPKQSIPTVSSLGLTSAADIGILFNATDPAGNGLVITDITLKFFDSAGLLLGAIDGSQPFDATVVGTGGAGFVFTVSPTEQAYVNGLLGGTTYLALEASLTGVKGGGESFSIINVNGPRGVPEPATWAMMLLGFGGIGTAMRRRRRNGAMLSQIA